MHKTENAKLSMLLFIIESAFKLLFKLGNNRSMMELLMEEDI